jgi:predicted O-methyltransferase YrrM
MRSFEEATLLYNLAIELKHGCIVEVGSHRGRSTVALGSASLDAHGFPVYAIEPHEKFREVLGGSPAQPNL